MIKYVVPSYHRPDGVKILKYLKKAMVYVSPEDYPDYIKCNPKFKDNIVMVPEGVQGKGKGHVENWMLDNLWDDDTDGMMILDDDITCLMMHIKNGTDVKVDEELFYEICEDYSLLAKEWGCGYFSFGLNAANTSWAEFAPFKLHAYIDGGMQGFVRNEGLRYDEKMTVKEDVDMLLQQLQKYHKALRVDRYYFRKKSFEGDGGCQEFRSSETEKMQFRMMQQKWGSKIIRPNRPTAKKDSSIKGLGGAIKLNIPLEGI